MSKRKSRAFRIDEELIELIKNTKESNDLDSYRQASRELAQALKKIKFDRKEIKF